MEGQAKVFIIVSGLSIAYACIGPTYNIFSTGKQLMGGTGMRFDRLEVAGSLGDLGTLLPLSVAMIVVNGLDPIGLFLSVGLMYVLGGLYFRVPIAVQPMKVVAAYSIAIAATPAQISAAGLLLGVFLLVIGLSGIMDVAAKFIPKPVVRGVQLSTGVLLMSKGVAFIAGTSQFQLDLGLGEPYLGLQSLGPVPLGLLLGTACGALTLFLLGNKRFPAAIAVVGAGLLAGVFLGTHEGFSALEIGPYLPRILPFGLPSGQDLGFAVLIFVLPQMPMTLGNAVIATRDLSGEYFGEQGSRVTDKALCVSMGLANLAATLFGGMPLCHGAGGLAAHYRFGARTGGSNLIVGGLFLVLAFAFGPHALALVRLMPLSVLGVLLVFAGGQLAMTIIDLRERKELFVTLTMAGIALASNLAWAFAVGLALSWLMRSKRVVV